MGKEDFTEESLFNLIKKTVDSKETTLIHKVENNVSLMFLSFEKHCTEQTFNVKNEEEMKKAAQIISEKLENSSYKEIFLEYNEEENTIEVELCERN